MMAGVTELLRLSEDEVLCLEGDPGDEIFIVAEGRLTIEMKLPDGSIGHLDRVGPGRMIGQISLIDGGPRSATVRAERDSAVIVYPRSAFERHYHAGSRYAFKILDMVISQLSEQVRDANATLARLSRSESEDRERLKSLLEQILDSSPNIRPASSESP